MQYRREDPACLDGHCQQPLPAMREPKRGWSPLESFQLCRPPVPGALQEEFTVGGPELLDPVSVRLETGFSGREHEVSPPVLLQDCTSQVLNKQAPHQEQRPTLMKPDGRATLPDADQQAAQAQVQWLYAHLAAQQAQSLQMQQELQMLRALAGGRQALATANAQWLALQLQQAQALAALSALSAQPGAWRGSAGQHSGAPSRQAHITPNDGLTHKERRRRRRAQEREAAAQLAMAAAQSQTCQINGPGLPMAFESAMLTQQLTS